MILYLTDNPEISKTLESSSALLYQLFGWKVSVDPALGDSSVVFRHTWKNKEIKKKIESHCRIKCIVAQSNYRLLYETTSVLKTLYPGKDVELYSWNGWVFGKKFSPNQSLLAKSFEEYLQRGYLSRNQYKELSSMNLNRIEQFVALLFVGALEAGAVKRDSVTPKRHFLVRAVEKIRKYYGGIPYYQAMERLIGYYRRMKISDPFIGKSFSFVKRKGSAENSSRLEKILKETDVGEEVHEKDFSLILSHLSDLFPLVDVFKMLIFLEKNGFIKEDGDRIFLENGFEPDEIVYYQSYLKKSAWKTVYKNRLFEFREIFPVIHAKNDSFSCPLCGFNDFSSKPHVFECKNLHCKFKISRIINPLNKTRKLKELEFKKLVKHGFVFIKNAHGGYSKYVMKKNSSGSCYIVAERQRNSG